MTSGRWSVCKRDGIWRVYDGPHWHESWPTLPEAHTAATQLAISTELFKPGGLTCFQQVFKPAGLTFQQALAWAWGGVR